MWSILCTALLALCALMAGWVECVRKTDEKMPLRKRVTKAGWAVLTVSLCLTLLTAIVDWAGDRESKKALKATHAELQGLRELTVANLSSDYDIRSWKVEADAVVMEFQFRLNAYINRMSSAAFFLGAVQELIDAKEQDPSLPVGVDELTVAFKQANEVFRIAVSDSVASLNDIAGALPKVLDKRGVRWKDYERQRAESIIATCNQMASPLSQDSMSSRTQAHAVPPFMRAASDLIHGMAFAAIQTEYVQKLNVLRQIDP